MNIDDVRASVVDRVVWLPQKGTGSFITFECGEPFLVTREALTGENVHPRLRRRRVTVQGEQHIWIQADDWILHSDDWTLLSSADEPEMSRGLRILAGQKLVDLDATSEGTTFRFEYGEALIIRPDQDPAETQWTIFWQTGNANWLSQVELKLEP